MTRKIFAILLAASATANAFAFEVWSGAYAVTTSEGVYHPFGGTFPMGTQDCVQETTQKHMETMTATEFAADEEGVLEDLRELIRSTCLNSSQPEIASE